MDLIKPVMERLFGEEEQRAGPIIQYTSLSARLNGNNSRMLVVELKSHAHREVDEWMYAIAESEKNDPYGKYNELMYKVYCGDGDYTPARATLQVFILPHYNY